MRHRDPTVGDHSARAALPAEEALEDMEDRIGRKLDRIYAGVLELQRHLKTLEQNLRQEMQNNTNRILDAIDQAAAAVQPEEYDRDLPDLKTKH